MDSQESSPTLQFKSINPSTPRRPNGPTLTYICGCWKNHSFDYLNISNPFFISISVFASNIYFLFFSFLFPSLHMLPIYSCMLSTLSIIAPSIFIILAVQFLSHVRVFATPWTAANQASLSFIISWNLLKLMSIESAIPSNHLVHLY